MKNILQEEGIDKKNICVYLFGSARYKIEYNDIDLLVTYKCLEYSSVIRLRQIMYDRLSYLFQKSIDIILLTDDEVRNTKFVEQESCELVF
ncbi:nucleotidyltransferase domain-containing protein [uncultured Eubacterium sp.]|jgi:hypothetical protein|uniref:nucleotidyltransferase domain-containing protein n=1 Tax=uncultured Eubacterium sp. TaxID=165185 RepID=UPI00280379EA|nr:nucleotidyltransferase domain-containing protein [uncultured Eubacterium sp.]